MFILFFVLSILFGLFSFFFHEKKRKFLGYSSFVLFLLFVVLSVNDFDKTVDKTVDKRSRREKSYDKLLTESQNIENKYIKNIIDDTTNKILESDMREKITITVPKDFNSLKRIKEHDETIRIIKLSGFKVSTEVEECVDFFHCFKSNKIEVW